MPRGWLSAWRVRQALPALANLFEVARLRLGADEKHPPQIVYVMLFGLGLGGLLAGFGMAAATARSWIQVLTFAATLTVALYVVTDMEYPRLGLINIENFDHFLVDALCKKCKRRDSGGRPSVAPEENGSTQGPTFD